MERPSIAALPMRPEDRVPERPETRHRDYILTDYAPACDPTGRLHSSSALRYALRVYDLWDVLWPILSAVRDALGPDETVWGFKTDGRGGIGLELYFYNFVRNAPPNPKRVTDLVALLSPQLQIDSRVDENIGYFMCSLDLCPALVRTGRTAGFRIYVSGERRRDGYDGISYLVDGDRLRLENYYTFYRAASELDQVEARVRASLRSGDEASCRALMPAHLRDCYTVCYATKPLHDALYYSRISTAALIRALTEHFPGPLPAFFEQHHHDFAHLRWDLGFDFCLTEPTSRTARVEKVGFYGIL